MRILILAVAVILCACAAMPQPATLNFKWGSLILPRQFVNVWVERDGETIIAYVGDDPSATPVFGLNFSQFPADSGERVPCNKDYIDHGYLALLDNRAALNYSETKRDDGFVDFRASGRIKGDTTEPPVWAAWHVLCSPTSIASVNIMSHAPREAVERDLDAIVGTMKFKPELHTPARSRN